MKAMRACALAALLGASAWAAPIGAALAQEAPAAQTSILVLDPDRLFQGSKFGQKMLAEHQVAREALAADNRRLEAELEAEEQRLTDIRSETPPEDFAEMANAFDDRVQEIRRDSDRRVNDLERERERLPIEFLRTVEPIMIALMEEIGGEVVLDRRTVMFRAGAIDVTDRAIARIDAELGAQ